MQLQGGEFHLLRRVPNKVSRLIDEDADRRDARRKCGNDLSRAGRPGRKFFDQVVRVDWPSQSVEVSQAGPRQYRGGEPAATGGRGSHRIIRLLLPIQLVGSRNAVVFAGEDVVFA